MFILPISIGIYSYIIYFLGLFGWLKTLQIIVVSAFYFLLVITFFTRKERFKFRLGSKLDFFILALILIQTAINFIGVLGPEISFDSLWYHLTLPKIFIQESKIFFIPGGVYYYSVMSKLVENLYIPGILMLGAAGAKIIHFFLGILCLLAIYKFSRQFVSKTPALLAVLIFYSNLVVGWETITAYVDLGRSLYEVLAIYAFILYSKSKKDKYLIFAAISLGFAIATKVLVIGSIFIFLVLIFYKNGKKIRITIIDCLQFVFFSLLIPLPYFVYSFLSTGNPFYPFFSSIYEVSPVISLQDLPKELYTLFLNAADPISPIYIIFIPLTFYLLRSFSKEEKLLLLYSLCALVIWYLTPRTGGGRFILPYLPVFSVLCVLTFSKIKNRLLSKYLILLVIVCSLISIGYRSVANLKFIPVVLGKETQEDFLEKHLNFEFGDFLDQGGIIKKLTHDQKVLIFGGHNLYYVDFPFTHESFANRKDRFNYILTIGDAFPSELKNYQKIYENDLTHAKLYQIR